MNVLPYPQRASDRGRTPAARATRLVNAALAVTAAAALLAWLLASVLHLSEQAVVLTVMAIAFTISWAVTNRRPVSHHRVTMIPARIRTH